MQELINELAAKANLSPEQAVKAIEVIKDFVKQKFPMFEGMVENLFSQNSGDNNPLDGFFK